MDENRLYNLIEQERKERIHAISEIHDRLDDIFAAINKIGKGGSNNNASWVRQSIGVTLGVLAILGFMVPTTVAIVKPIQQHIQMVSARVEKVEEHAAKDGHPIYHSATLQTIAKRMERIEKRNGEKIEALDKRLKVQMEKEGQRTQARLHKLEDWQKWWLRNQNGNQKQ